ncbi:MAG: hypothetical protein K2G03_03380 [Bacilli bacterium]|nr:hypothetical protein [Bacilli bacterium]
MELIRKEDKKLIVTQYVGEACRELTLGNKEKYELSTTLQTSPVVTFPNGDQVIFEWTDIIKLAEKYRNEGKIG